MIKKTLFTLIIFLGYISLSTSAVSAKDYGYQGKITGMECAFCAYNVSKKIALLAGVNTSSVTVDPKGGIVEFFATSAIEKQQITAIFLDSGFTLIDFKAVDRAALSPIRFSWKPLITLKFEGADIEKLKTILDTVGDLAEAQPMLLSIKAPQAMENTLLQPILASRQTIIKVNFVPSETNNVVLNLYPMVKSSQ